jgi:hypothetical protein
MLHRLIAAYSAWNERSRAKALHFHAGSQGAYACDRRLCDKWSISGDDAARLGFE